MDLEIIINKIKTFYQNELTEDEYFALCDSPTEFLVRKLIMKIWHNYLSDPFAFEPKKEFKFLVATEILLDANLKLNEYLTMQKHAHHITLYTPQNIENKQTGTTGFVIEVDWMNSKELLLPVDFEEKPHLLAEGLSPLAICCITAGEGAINNFEYNAIEIAKTNKLPFIGINKKDYIEGFVLSKIDQDCLVDDIITAYLFEEDLISGIGLKTILAKKYRRFILKRYDELNNQGLYEANEFMEEIFTHIQNKEKKSSLRV